MNMSRLKSKLAELDTLIAYFMVAVYLVAVWASVIWLILRLF